MPSETPTNAVEIFARMAAAADRGVPMTPRSANDKEYFAQDWFSDRLDEAGLPYDQQGRHSYPDFIITGPSVPEGYEIKSLAFVRGRPARRDIDFNSTIPSGRKQERDVFLVFFLYEGTGAGPRTVHSISMAHADLLNCDHELADEHLNVAVHLFGSYADGFIRNRKMYVFPHPISLDPQGLGRRRLIVPAHWNLADARLKRVSQLKRKIARRSVDSYTIRLRGRGQPEVSSVSHRRAGETLRFDVFELA